MTSRRQKAGATLYRTDWPLGWCLEEDHGMLTPCLVWQGTADYDGYALVRIEGRLHRLHRLAYEAVVGPVPEGMVLHHHCHESGCLNTAHMEPLTRAQHMAEHRSALYERWAS